MSLRPNEPGKPIGPDEEKKSPDAAPVSPRTGRTLDNIDNLPDNLEATGSRIYKMLESIQEAFFPIDKAKRFPREDSSKWSDAALLQRINENPFNMGRLYELLRRFRKGQILETVVTSLYSGSEVQKRLLLDNIAVRMSAGAFVIETKGESAQNPNNPNAVVTKLESPQLEAFLDSIYESGYITSDEALKFCSDKQLAEFIRQKNGEEIVDLPTVKPDQPPFEAPTRTHRKTLQGAAVFRVQDSGKTSETIVAPSPAQQAIPAATPTAPATPASVKGAPPTSPRKPTLLGMSVPPPADGSAPGAPAASARPLPPITSRPASTQVPPVPSSKPEVPPRLPPRLQPAPFDPALIFSDQNGPKSVPAVTVREGASRVGDYRTQQRTFADDGSLAAAIGREQTIAEVGETAPPSLAPKAVSEAIPPTSRPLSASKKPGHLPPPLPGNIPTIETKETDFQLLHAVTIISEAGVSKDVPLMLADGEFTIGANPKNDIVLPNPPDCETVAEFHAAMKISGDSISIKGVKGPLKLEPKPDRKGLVMYNYMPVNADESIRVGRVVSGKADRYVEIRVKLDEAFQNKEIKDHFSERCKSLLRTAAQKIVESIQEYNPATSALTGEKSDEAKALVKKAIEIFGGLLLRLPNEIKDTDFTNWKNIAFSNAQLELSKRLSDSIASYGQELLKSVKQLVTEAITNGTEIAAINLETDPPKFFNDYINFARSIGINVNKTEHTKELDLATSHAKRFLAEKKQVEADIKEADRRRAELEDEVKNRPQRDHEAALKQFRQIYAGVHYREEGDGKELLTPETKFAHVGPVLIIRDTSGKIIHNGIRPLLTHHQTLGTHDINTIELPHDHDPKRGTKPFMASIDFDERERQYRMTWIDGEIRIANNEGGSGMPTTPVFGVESNRAVFVGKYLVKIEENHAFTDSSIKAEYANPLAEELLEVVFDEAVTTLDQTATAYSELKTLAATGFVNMPGLKAKLAEKITDLWGKIQEWNPNIDIEQSKGPDSAPSSPRQTPASTLVDAQKLGTLYLLLKDHGGFIPRIENITQAAVIDAAKKRLDAFVEFDNKSKEPGPKFPKIVGLFNAGKKRMAEQEKQKNEAKNRANIGVVEVARFLDMGVFKQEIVNAHPDISGEYCDRINEIYRVRKLIDEIRNGGKDIENFELLMQLCGDKKMNEVFSSDEIAAFNVNIEINVNEKTPVQQYVKKLFVFLGRAHVRQLGNVENKKSIATIEKLLAIKAVTYDEIVVPPYFMGNEVKNTIEDAKMLAQIKADADAEEAILRIGKIEALQRQAEIKRIHRQALVEKFAQAVDAVGIAQQQTRLDVLVAIADIINDKKVEEEMDGDGISMETIRYASELPTTTSKFKDRAVAIVAERQQVGWHKFKEDYKVVATNIAQKTAEKIMKADPDSAYQFEVLVEALEKGIVTEGNIGYTAEQLKQKVAQTTREQKERQYRNKYRPFFDENKVRAVDNLDYLGQIKLDQIQDPAERQVAEQIIEDISFIRMTAIIEKIQSGEDASYMKMVGNELLEKGYRAQLHFPAEKLALLQ